MILKSSIEYDALTFNHYDNGINAIVYHESSKQGVDDFITCVETLIEQHAPNDTIRVLSDLRKTGHQPLGYHYSEIKKLNDDYAREERPKARFGNVYDDITSMESMAVSYVLTHDLSGVEIKLFTDYDEAVAWLLRDD